VDTRLGDRARSPVRVKGVEERTSAARENRTQWGRFLLFTVDAIRRECVVKGGLLPRTVTCQPEGDMVY
jgi:hypothetical protein